MEETIMQFNKVLLVTGATGTIGQHLLSFLVSKGYKIIALGEGADSFSPEILNNKHVKITTALPISKEQFKKYDIQFCFGDTSEISFLASVFATADKNDLEIEFIFHLAANQLLQKHSKASYHPEYGDIANILEVTNAYWQEHKKTLKGFFYVADSNNHASKQIEELINKMTRKESFPIIIYKPRLLSDVVGNYQGSTSLASLYRFLSPVKAPVMSMAWKKEADDELGYIAGLKKAAEKILSQIKEGKKPEIEQN